MTSSKAPKVQGRKPDKGGSSPPKTRRRRSADVDLREQLDEARRELREAREQQTAAADVLKVISRSTFDLQTVLDTLTASATRLCAVDQGVIFLRDGDVLRLRASYGFPPEAVEYALAHPMLPNRGSATGRVALEGRPVHIEDVLADPEYSVTDYQRTFGYRTVLSVPLLHEGSTIGVFALTRDVVEPFSNRQIELATTFADQAVIAIENTRLLNELRESLQQQTATADVLKVISRSAFDIQAVLNTLVATAGRLCQAENVQIFLCHGELYHLSAHNGFSPEYQEYAKQHPIAVGRGTLVARTALEVAPVHIPDILADAEYTWHEGQRLGGFRAALGVPLIRDGNCVGVMALSRPTPQPFTGKLIELATTFADQAVIAIQNARLFEEVQERTRETQESLEYQTAISEVLEVISRSPSDIQPVLDTIAETAQRLCQSEHAYIMRLDRGRYYPAAAKDARAERIRYLKEHPVAVDRGSVCGRVALERRTIHVTDALADPDYTLSMAGDPGYRTILGVPLLRDGVAIGVIVLTRAIVRPFSDEQIGLVSTFADQALIAIENVRLFEAERERTRELSASLDQQTAASEVLQLISSSPGELGPVFQTMLENAVRICGAKFGTLFLRESDAFRVVATHNAPPAHVEALTRDPLIRPPPDVPLGLVAATKQVAYVADIKETQSYRERHPFVFDAVELAGYRSVLAVPMLKDKELVGSINILRPEVGPFGDKQIELVQNFAKQAVIAIENTRLLNELREVVAAADCDCRCAQGDQPLHLRSSDRTRYAGRVGRAAVRRGHGEHLATQGGKLPSCGELRRRKQIQGVDKEQGVSGGRRHRTGPGDDRRTNLA